MMNLASFEVKVGIRQMQADARIQPADEPLPRSLMNNVQI